MASERMCILVVLTDRQTGERWPHAVLWSAVEGDRIREQYNKLSRWECVTYLAYEGDAWAVLKGVQPLPAPVDVRTLGPYTTQKEQRNG